MSIQYAWVDFCGGMWSQRAHQAEPLNPQQLFSVHYAFYDGAQTKLIFINDEQIYERKTRCLS